MKKSTIQLQIELDEKNIPERITWDASDKPGSLSESKSISLSVWDHREKNTLRIDLWTKDMPVNEMKKFYIDCLGGVAQSALSATGDEYITQEIKNLCERLSTYLQKDGQQKPDPHKAE